MTKKYFFLFLLFLFSCNKDKKFESELKNSDSIFNYIKSIKSDEKITVEKKLLEYTKALEIYKKTKNSKILRENIFDLATEFYLLDDLNNFKSASKTLLILSTKTKDSLLLAKSNRYLGRFYANKELNDSAFYYYIKSEKLYEKLGRKEDYATIQLNKGIIQYTVNDFLGADYSLTKALSVLKNSDDKQKLYQIYLEISVVSVELKNYKKAIEFQTKAINLAKDYKFDDLLEIEIIGYNNLGFIYQSLEIHDKAIENFLLAYQTDKKRKVKSYLTSKILDNLGYSKLKSNDLTNLPDLFFESLKIRDSLGNLSLITGSYIHISEYYNKTKDYNKSIEFANKALITAKKSKIPADFVAALKQAAEVDKINASQYTNQYIRINDSLQVAERKNLDRFARIQLETDEVIKENKVLDTKNQNLLYYLFGFAILALVGGLLFVIFRQRTKQKELLFLQSQQDANENIYQLLLEQQAKVAEVLQSEKTRIALELHDGIMNKLASIRLNLFVLSEKTDPATISKCLDHITDIQTIETEIRNVAHDLNQEVFLEKNSFKLLISEFVSDQNSNQKTQFDIEMDPQIDWEKINNTIKVNLFRIIQEATNNCNKHANATKAVIAFVLDENKICMSFIDNGIGADLTTNKEGIGIKNMNQRIKFLEGSISIKSESSTGTQIYLAVPIDKL